MASSSRKKCLQCDTLISHEFRNGWRLMSGESVHLCDGCVSVFEEGRFCETFHSEDDGWRTCVSCKKLVHCGCMMSFQDFGRVICMQCSKAKFILVNSTFCHHLQVSNENLETLDSWLERKVNAWMNSEKNLMKSSKASWWSFIESDFQWLFRDITRKLWTVYDNGKSHGSIEDHIFVDGTRGVLYPVPIGSQGLNAESLNADMKSLKKTMVKVIGKPFGIEDIQTDMTFWTGVIIGDVHCQGCLPMNLQSFIYELEGEFMNTTNVKFMLDCDFFWTGPERVHFLNKFVDLLSRGVIDYNSLSWVFNWTAWHDLLEGTEFQKAFELYYSASPPGDLDIIRFCKNELWHHNDKYKGRNEYNKMLDQEEIEALLNNIFEGSIYWKIKQSLLNYSQDCDPMRWKKIREKLLGPTI